MRPLLFSLLLAAILLTLPLSYTNASAFAQANQGSVASIESYARGLDVYIKRNARAARYFADTASYNDQNAPARWQEFRTKRALDSAWQNGKTYTSSNVWFSRTGEPVVALFTLSSPSGDWVQYVTNYYRKDGTLAKTNAELRTFMGDVIRISDRLYDERGKLLKEQTRFLDLQTRKPKRVNKDQFMDMEVPHYATTSALPFYKLLKK
ncbi:MAG: hypothetical protein ICV60_05810 [Pyrinomonadaceae bacterium]|nr:hypothetical protein [Pyrinomonadaceae bacterium]